MNIPTSTSPPKGRRLDYIDLLRGWAVIVMVETHVFNATLASEVKGSDFFDYVMFVNGLVAPSFLFASGLAFAITTRRKLNDYLSFGAPLFKQFGRLLFVLCIGYLLHLPKFNYAQLVYSTEERQWRVFFQADVLQCIAVSLIFMQVLLLVLKREQWLYMTLVVVCVAVVFLTPVVWGMDFWPILPAFFAGYTNGMHFPNFPGFPLFPWTAFIFAGAIVGYFYLKAKDAGVVPGSAWSEVSMMYRMLWVAPAIIVLSAAIEPLAASAYPTYDYWKFSPSFYLLRMGIVMLLCVGMFFYERNKGVSPGSAITLMGRESLIVYATHLLLIYGNFSTFNFAKRVNHSFGYGEALIATFVLLVLMYALARFWNSIKKESPRWKMVLEFGTLAVLVGVFFFGPGQ